jgi:phosphoribosylamine--glycine ligase/phosphoribosylformylglycinamidine cyclo-ligase
MKVLLIGSGGREHTIAWKLAQSPKLTQLFTLPGNPGTAEFGDNVSGDPLDVPYVVKTAQELGIDLVIVGPEAPLDRGLADVLQSEGIAVFGPGFAGAQLEASKSFSKAFMQRHNIPTTKFAVFEELDDALKYVNEIVYPFVIKASGLAAGKGVFLPDTIAEAQVILKQIMEDKRFGEAGNEVVIEERLSGPEVSVLAFTDGESFSLMPAAQDHKRLLDNDEGPNTGGMGVFAPSPKATEAVLQDAVDLVFQPTIDGLKEEGIPYNGVLYAGLMLTNDGVIVLEFNCRFGDPETQVILPLLDSDLLDIANACAKGKLAEIADEIKWNDGGAACVVLASKGYPDKYDKGFPITGLEQIKDIQVFHAGTATQDRELVTNGGRVLGVTAVDVDIPSAVRKVYKQLSKIQFEGMQYRTDIGRQGSAYAAAGVSIETGNLSMQMIRDSVNATHGPEVLTGIGSFGGLFDAGVLKGMDDPVLVGSTDGVGTKVMLAEKYSMLENVGMDIVNHCIDDILVQGARPLFFLDYYATSRLIPEQLAEVVSGISKACLEAGCAILGGETAEMPGVYGPGQFDLAGTIVGVVEKEKVLPKGNIQEGDKLIGIRSTGPHTNGYSLIRKIFENTDLGTVFPEIGMPLGEVLLTPHRSYLNMLWPILQHYPEMIKGLAHLTGGGFYDNIPRILPDGLSAVVRIGSWPVLPVFELIQKMGNVDPDEMYHVFNMGIGMIAVTAPEHASRLQDEIVEDTWVIGEVVKGKEVQIG